MGFKLSENLLNNLAQGAGFNAGGAMTQGLANYKKTKQEGIVNAQKQEQLDLQKQQVANTMTSYKMEQEQKKAEFDATADYRANVLKETNRKNLADEAQAVTDSNIQKNKYVPIATHTVNGRAVNTATGQLMSPNAPSPEEHARHVAVVATGMESARSIPKTHEILGLLNGVKTGSIEGAIVNIKKLFGVESADEGQLTNLLLTNVLPQLKKIFGSQFTEKEGKLLLGIEPGLGNSSEANIAILERRLGIMEDEVGFAMESSALVGDNSANSQMAQLMGEWDPVKMAAKRAEEAENNKGLDKTEDDLTKELANSEKPPVDETPPVVAATPNQQNVTPRRQSSFEKMQARRTPVDNNYYEGGGI